MTILAWYNLVIGVAFMPLVIVALVIEWHLRSDARLVVFALLLMSIITLELPFVLFVPPDADSVPRTLNALLRTASFIALMGFVIHRRGYRRGG